MEKIHENMQVYVLSCTVFVLSCITFTHESKKIHKLHVFFYLVATYFFPDDIIVEKALKFIFYLKQPHMY